MLNLALNTSFLPGTEEGVGWGLVDFAEEPQPTSGKRYQCRWEENMQLTSDPQCRGRGCHTEKRPERFPQDTLPVLFLSHLFKGHMSCTRSRRDAPNLGLLSQRRATARDWRPGDQTQRLSGQCDPWVLDAPRSAQEPGPARGLRRQGAFWGKHPASSRRSAAGEEPREADSARPAPSRAPRVPASPPMAAVPGCR